MPEAYTHPISVRYLEVDQQGVAFNMWYLAYFDDALTGFLEHNGVPYRVLTDAGLDVQLVHSEIDWTGGVAWQDDVGVTVTCLSIGTTSFALAFDVLRSGASVATGRTVYVVIATDGSGKRRVPDFLRRALQPGV